MFRISSAMTRPSPLLTSRRAFLSAAGKMIVVSCVAGVMSLNAKSSLAYDMKSLPPGFWPEVCKDDMISGMFGEMYFGLGNLTQWDIKDRLMRKIGLESKQVKQNSPFTEPAYWFTVSYFNFKFQQRGLDGMIDERHLRFYDQVKIQSPAMDNWSAGIGSFFGTWVGRDKRFASPENTEAYLLKAIFTAAGRSGSEAASYLTLDMAGKEAKLKELMTEFSRIADRMKQGQAAADKQRVSSAQQHNTDAKTLDKQVFILEKRLQREKLSYEKEYALTQELKQLKTRQQALAQGAATQQSQSSANVTSDEYTRLLVAGWARHFLQVHYYLIRNTKIEPSSSEASRNADALIGLARQSRELLGISLSSGVDRSPYIRELRY